MEIELTDFTKGESSSATAEDKGKGIELTRGESSTATSQSNVDSDLEIDISQLHFGRALRTGTNFKVCKGFYKGNTVVIKEIYRKKDTNIVSPERRDKFLREVRTMSKVQHENIVKFIGFSQNQSLIMVTEFMVGGSLQQHLSNIPSPGTLSLKDALTFALGISRAMEHLHGKGIIHRHLKPSNIFLTEDKKNVKVGDFGLCREEVDGDLTPEAGTLPWMAPEVFLNQGGLQQLIDLDPDEIERWLLPKYNSKADVYSFSLVLWEMLTNTTPFEGVEDDQKMRYAVAGMMRPSLDRIPADIHPLLTTCWAVDPDLRPDFSQISRILEELLSNISPRQAIADEILPVSEPSRPRTEDALTDDQIDELVNMLPSRARTEESLPKKSRTLLVNTAKKIRTSLFCCFATCVGSATFLCNTTKKIRKGPRCCFGSCVEEKAESE